MRAERALDRKELALCHKVQHALESAIAAECKDEVLNELTVLSVEPEPTTRRLRVWLRRRAEMNANEREDVLTRLAAARGFLRAEVAAAIHRKRTPELVFELLSGVPRPDGDLR